VGSQAEEASGEEEEEIRDDQVEEAPVPKKSKKKTDSPAKKRTNAAAPRRFQFSVTIVMKGEDIDADVVEPKLEEFVKSNTERAIICFERGDLENHLHVQALMVAVATTPAQFKLSVEKALGYEKGKRPVNLSICLRQLTGKGIHTVEGIVGYCRKAKDSVDFREVCHNITDKDKAKGDLLFILHGKSDSSKAKVALTSRNIISKMQVFLKYKTKTILRHMRDPLCLILKMMRTGHYELPSYWVQEKGGLDLVRFNSLWKSNVSPEELEVKDIVNVLFPRAHFGGQEEGDSTDEETNFTQTCSSAGLRDDTHSNDKRHRVRYFNREDKVKRVTDGVRFQDAYNDFKGQKARKILSDTLKGFDENEYYYEIKDYSDPVFSDDIFGIFTSKDNLETRMMALDDIMVDIERDRELYVPEFTKGDDFVSLVSSRIKIDNLIDAAQEESDVSD
jgi:hypothetical protein